MSKVLRYLPEIEDDEQLYVARLMTDMSEEQAQQFAHIYHERRRDPTLTLLLALVGFLGVAGLHRFFADEIGMGLLYLFTAGLCFVGTIVDLFNYKSIAFRYNRRQADDVAALVAGAFPDDASDDASPALDA